MSSQWKTENTNVKCSKYIFDFVVNLAPTKTMTCIVQEHCPKETGQGHMIDCTL